MARVVLAGVLGLRLAVVVFLLVWTAKLPTPGTSLLR